MWSSLTRCLPSSQGELTELWAFGGTAWHCTGSNFSSACERESYEYSNTYWWIKPFSETIAPFAKWLIYSSEPWLPGADKTDKDFLIQHTSRGNMMVSKYWASYACSFPSAGRGLCKETIRKVKQWRWHKKGHNQKAKLNENKETKSEKE